MDAMEETTAADYTSPMLNDSKRQEDIQNQLNSSVLMSFRKKQVAPVESIYNCKDRKVKHFKLQADSNSMGFAVYLKKEFLGMDFSET